MSSNLTPVSEKRALLLCLSHLRWGFVFQRPQHLMTRLARSMDIVFWEEPIFDSDVPRLDRTAACDGVTVVTPHLAPGTGGAEVNEALRALLDEALRETGAPQVLWYYTPMMLPFTRHLEAECTVYDCMDELANFDFAPPELPGLERDLFAKADLVFTGGYSLYEAKRDVHPSVHPFPSSVDTKHFATARDPNLAQPADQAAIGGKRLGFYGVIDERIDLKLLADVADARPDWSLVMVGPVVKIDPASLPKRENIFYLGGKTYDELPAYAGGWDVALMPFAINAATRFISPTKTPEYLAAGKPVVSTPIKDVIRHYGKLQGVAIASTAEEFVAACEDMLALDRGPGASWLVQSDKTLSAMSWNAVVNDMRLLIEEKRAAKRATSLPHYDYLVVGAGFAGSVMAERLAADSGKSVLVVDRRPHIAGNAFDHLDDSGILIHQYGPHIFHANSQEIVDYLSRFTEWRPYEHRVLAAVGEKLVPMPINRTTLNMLHGLDLKTDGEAEAYLESLAEPVETIRTSEDVVVSKVGRELYETFFRGYTRKQWGMDPSELDKSVTSRVPTRTNDDDRYFTDKFQAMPAKGYTAMFERMLDHPNITLRLGEDYRDVRDQVTFDHLVFTGPIDEYFDFRFGKLPYRSLEFKHVSLEQETFQSVATVNYPAEDVPYTRITEYKYLTGQQAPNTSITYEYPRAEGDPYYPVPRPENEALFKRYEALADATEDVTFVGRLATYRYYNMDQVVGQALATYRRLIAKQAASDNDVEFEAAE